MAMDRIVGRVQIENDLLGRLWVGVEEEVDEQALDRRPIMADAVIARGRARGGVLQPVQGRLAGQRRAIAAPRGELAGEHRQDRIVPDLVMVDQVLVSERDPEDALADKGCDIMLDAIGSARVGEAGGEAPDEVDGPIRGAEQQRAGIGCDRSAIEGRHDGPPFDRCKQERFRATLCRHRGSPLSRAKSLLHNNFDSLGTPMHPTLVRNAG
jgi:hypothetical protein